MTTNTDREAASTRLAREETRIAWVADVLLDRIQWCILEQKGATNV